MEVHAHAHTERKKFKHYLWEFLMLFLAVFCGFLAENQREQMVEHKREKEFMRTMIEDLKTDTTEMNKVLSNVDTNSRNIDSMLLLLTTGPVNDNGVIGSYQFTFPALNNIPIVFNDRTITQLKNSGNMRLIRNQKVNDGIIQYWKHIENIIKALDRHAAYRTRGRDMETRIFNLAEIFLKNQRKIGKPTEKIHLIADDPQLIKEYSNVVAYCGVMLNSLRELVKEQYRLATKLIELIKKEYHLD